MKQFIANITGIIKSALTRPMERSILLDGQPVEVSGNVFTARESTEPISVPRNFKLILLVTASLSVLSLAVAVFIANQSELSELQNDLFETCTTTWKMGFGAVIGLTGGKAIK